MAKPGPSPLLLGRLFSAILIAGMVWLLLANGYSIIAAVQSLMSQNRMAPYASVLSTGDMNRAHALFDRDIRSHPTDPDTYKSIAAACVQANRTDLAVEYLEKSLLPCKDAPRSVRAESQAVITRRI